MNLFTSVSRYDNRISSGDFTVNRTLAHTTQLNIGLIAGM